MEEIEPAPGLLKKAFAPAMDAAATRVACTARPMVPKICFCFPKAAAPSFCLAMGCVMWAGLSLGTPSR